MKKINIEISNAPTCYDIIIAENSINKIDNFISNKSKYSKIVLIFDSNIDSNIVDIFKKIFNDIVCIPINLELNKKKSFNLFLDIQSKLIEYNFDKDLLILSLGGGSIGDLVGFIASTYKRGINYIQIPTTLLGMLDSSIGGKTGIDSRDGKNLIGTFYHPELVFIDINFLSTLKKEEITSGIFEAIKYGVALDSDLFLFINENKEDLYNIDILKKIIEWCCEIKTNIIVKDEKDKGLRNKLNFGHTIGHAVESNALQNGGDLLHGEAVAVGMAVETILSQTTHDLSEDECGIILASLKGIFPLQAIAESKLPDLIEWMRHDKKNDDSKINFTLLKKIGEAEFNKTCSEDQIEAAIKKYNSFLNF